MRLLLGVVAAGLLLVGCEEGGEERLLLGRQFDDDCEASVGFCDITEEDCQQRVFDATACIRQQDDAELPSVRTLDVEALRIEVTEMADEAGAFEPSPWDAAFRLLQLVPAEQSSAEASVDDFVTGVAAYYDPQTAEVTIVDAAEETDDRIDSSILSHEFVHVLQDRVQGFEDLDERWVRSTDSAIALDHLVEGEATVLAAIFTAAGDGASERQIAWSAYFDDMLETMLMVIEEAPAPFITAISTLPYPVGGRLLADVRREGGQRALEALYEDGPGMTVDWMLDEGLPRAPEAVVLPDCYPEPPAAGRGVVGLDTFGAAGLLGFLVGQGLTGPEALQLSLELEVDSLAVLVDADSQQDVAVDWRLTFTSAAAAGEVVAAVSSPAIGAELDGARVRLWAAEPGVPRDDLEGRTGCVDAKAIADALLLDARAAAARGVRGALPMGRRALRQRP